MLKPVRLEGVHGANEVLVRSWSLFWSTGIAKSVTLHVLEIPPLIPHPDPLHPTLCAQGLGFRSARTEQGELGLQPLCLGLGPCLR